MRHITKSEQTLLEFCSQFRSEKELKEKAPHKHVILKRKNLLKYLFPVHTCKLPPNYVPPYMLDNYKTNTLSTIQKILDIAQEAYKDISDAKTTNEIDRLHNKTIKVIKELI